MSLGPGAAHAEVIVSIAPLMIYTANNLGSGKVFTDSVGRMEN